MNALRPVFVIVAGALLIAGIYAAGVRGAADRHFVNARLALLGASAAKRTPQEGELVFAATALSQSLALEPSNPHFVEQSARVLEMRALRVLPGDPAARQFLRRALEQYRAAALMRPGSPFVWVGIATIKLRLTELDYEFFGALQRADRLGRWEPEVQRSIAGIGLSGWELLPRTVKRQVLEAMERGMARQGAEMRRLAAQHPNFAALCAQEITLRGRHSGVCVKK
jgi:hypothetical protein